MKYKQDYEIKKSIPEVKNMILVARIKPTKTKMTNENEKIESAELEELQNAIKEIHFLIQVLQDVPITNSISRDIQRKFIDGMVKEEENYVEYMNSTFGKQLDNLIECQMENLKLEKEECQI